MTDKPQTQDDVLNTDSENSGEPSAPAEIDYSAFKEPPTAFDAAKKYLVGAGIPLAKFLALCAVAFFIVLMALAYNTNSTEVREYDEDNHNLAQEVIRERAIAQIRVYRILGKINDKVKTDQTGGKVFGPAKDQYLGSVLGSNLDEPATPVDAIRFTDGLSTYIASLAVAEGAEESLVELVANGADGKMIDDTFTEWLANRFANKESELKAVIEALVATSLGDVDQTHASIAPTLADPTKNTSLEQFKLIKSTIIANNVETSDALRLLTKSTKVDETDKEPALAGTLFVTKYYPFEGLGDELKRRLPRPVPKKISPFSWLTGKK